MQKRNRQRNFPFVAALSLALCTLAGCGGGSGTSGNSLVATPVTGAQDPGTVTVAPPPPPASTATTTGSATISWRAPSTNTDGTPLTNLAGFYIRYGYSHAHLDQLVKISSVNILDCMIAGLPVGTVFYFAVSSFTSNGVESDKSVIVSKKI